MAWSTTARVQSAAKTVEVVAEMSGEAGPDARVLAVARQYVDQADLDGPWFDLGGSSIDAARLVSELDQQFGVALSLRDLLCAASVGECLSAATAARVEPLGDPAATAATPEQGAAPAVDLLWPSLVRLPAAERVKLAHRLLGTVLQRGSDRPADMSVAGR
jgi:acyl carrier protein